MSAKLVETHLSSIVFYDIYLLHNLYAAITAYSNMRLRRVSLVEEVRKDFLRYRYRGMADDS